MFSFNKYELELKRKDRVRVKRYTLIYREFKNEIILINKEENKIVLIII